MTDPSTEVEYKGLRQMYFCPGARLIFANATCLYRELSLNWEGLVKVATSLCSVRTFSI